MKGTLKEGKGTEGKVRGKEGLRRCSTMLEEREEKIPRVGSMGIDKGLNNTPRNARPKTLATLKGSQC